MAAKIPSKPRSAHDLNVGAENFQPLQRKTVVLRPSQRSEMPEKTVGKVSQCWGTFPTVFFGHFGTLRRSQDGGFGGFTGLCVVGAERVYLGEANIFSPYGEVVGAT